MSILLKSLIREIIQEDPDGITIPSANGENMDIFWQDREVHSIFSGYNIHGKDVLFAVNRDKKNFYSSDEEFERRIDEYVEMLFSRAGGLPDVDIFYGNPSHKRLNDFLVDALPDIGLTKDFKKYAQNLFGRIFQYEKKFYCSFWNKKEIVVKYQDLILQYLKDVGIPVESTLFEPADYPDNFISVEELFGPKKTSPSSVDDLTIQQKRELHLNPELKKKVLNLPPRGFVTLADKLNMTPIQLKQLMGMDVAE